MEQPGQAHGLAAGGNDDMLISYHHAYYIYNNAEADADVESCCLFSTADECESCDVEMKKKGVAVLCLSAVFSSAMLVLFLHRQRKARGGKKLLRLMLIIIANHNHTSYL